MRNNVREMIDRILHDKAERRRWAALGAVCSLVAVVTVFMALSFPSITVTGEDAPADIAAQEQLAAEQEAAFEQALAEAQQAAVQEASEFEATSEPEAQGPAQMASNADAEQTVAEGEASQQQAATDFEASPVPEAAPELAGPSMGEWSSALAGVRLNDSSAANLVSVASALVGRGGAEQPLDFIRFALYGAGVTELAMPEEAEIADEWARRLEEADQPLYAEGLPASLCAGMLVFFEADDNAGADVVAVVELVAEPEAGAVVAGDNGDAAQKLADETGARCAQVIYQDKDGMIVRAACPEAYERIVGAAVVEAPEASDASIVASTTGEDGAAAESFATTLTGSAPEGETVSYNALRSAPVSTPEQPANPGGNTGGNTGSTATPIAYQLLEEGSHGNTTWKVEIINGVQTLTITPKPGTDGRMYIENPPYYMSSYITPWESYASTIGAIIVEDGVSEISYAAFRGISHVDTLRLPDSVATIRDYAFMDMKALRKINPNAQNDVNLPSGLSHVEGNQTFMNTSIVSIDFSDGITGGSYWNQTFYGCKNLEHVHLPDGVTELRYTFGSCPNIKDFNIPKTVTSLFYVMNKTPVETVNYDSAATKNQARSFNIDPSPYQSYVENRTLYIGNDVNYLPRNIVESLCNSAHNGIIRFKANSEFEMESLAGIAKLASPLSVLSAGRYHADAQGALYRIYADHVELVYVPDADDANEPITDYTVPASIMIGNGTPLPVTAVGSHCIASAKHLTALTFADSAAITSVASEAFAQCPTLTSFNGASSVQGAEASLPNVSTNVYTFEFTGLTHDYITQSSSVEIKNGTELSISVLPSENRTPTQDQNGTYNYYTGEAASITISISNPDNNANEYVHRVYMQFESADATISYPLGTHYFNTSSGKTYTAHLKEADTPFTYYWEIETPDHGDTLAITFTVGYPSPASDGGELVLTGNILTPQENEDAGNAYLEPTTSPDGKEHYIELDWATKPDRFPVTKSSGGDGAWEGHKDDETPRLYATGISFDIDAPRVGETLEGIGKDYVVCAEFTDTFTIGAPGEYGTAIKWRDDVLAAIKAGAYGLASGYQKVEVTVQTENGPENVELMRFDSVLLGVVITVDPADDSKLIVSWTENNASTTVPTHEILSLKQKITLGNEVLVVEDPAYFNTTAHVFNTVTLTNHYSHSAPHTTTASAEVEIKPANASLSFQKYLAKQDDSSTVDYEASYIMGDRRPYALTAANEGSAPYTGSNMVFEDMLSEYDGIKKYLYITAEGIARMFGETCENERLTIRISEATLTDLAASGVVSTITSTDGQAAKTDAYTSSGTITEYGGLYEEGNAQLGTSDTTVITNNATIEFRNFNGDALVSGLIMDVSYPNPANPGETVAYSKTIGASGADYASVRDALDAIGHLVVSATTYYVKWETPGDFVIYGGQEVTRTVHSSIKDTFMLLQYDQEEEYNKGQTNLGKPTNKAQYSDDETQKSASYYDSTSFERDFRFDKDSNIDAVMPELIDVGQSGVDEGSIIRYDLSFSHKGHSRYEVLPLVDHMQNSQALLVPVAQNAGNAQLSALKQICVDGVAYYYVDTPGVYRNVYVGADESGNIICADTVTVALDATGGFDTIIKWYFKDVGNLETGASESHRVSIMGYARYDMNVQGDGSIKVNNEGYLNDHMGRRLWEHVGPVFSRYAINKEVQDEDGGWAKYAILKQGKELRYRLTINNSSNSAVTLLLGSYLKDYLPASTASHPWIAADITIDYNGHAGSAVTGSEFTITTPDPTHPERQLLTWNDDFYFKLNQGNNYIYITLTMPTDDAEWQEFEQAYAQASLKNIFSAFGQDSEVSHDVSVGARPLLQKGVLATYQKRIHGGTGTNELNNVVVDTSSEGLFYYSNDDSWEHGVAYAVTLYNEGPGKLYVNDFQDQLPEGFTFFTVGRLSRFTSSNSIGRHFVFGKDNNGNLNNIPTMVVPADGSSVNYKSFRVDSSVSTVDGRQVVTFSISQYSTTSGLGYNTIGYDEAAGKYYLLPGEAICFSYFVRTNNVEDTLDTALNTVGMEYDDSLSDFVGLADAAIEVNNLPLGQLHNEGGCDVTDASTVETRFGFTSSDSQATFLTSDVELVRGGIAPGITKSAIKATNNLTGNVIDDPLSAEPQDTITWEIVSTNAGNQPIQDYTLTDTIQAPYEIVGSVYFELYQPTSSYPTAYSIYPGSNGTRGQLFIINSRTTEADGRTRLNIAYARHYSASSTSRSEVNVYVNGDPVTLDVCLYCSSTAVSRIKCPMQLQITKDANGNETLELRVMAGQAGIPAFGGKAVLRLDTKNPTNQYKTEVIYNSTWITPNAQFFSQNVNQGNYTVHDVTVTDNDGNYVVAEDSPSVKNSAPITIAYGTVTSSVKSVRELGLPSGETNEAYSNLKGGLPDRITLTDDESLFRYRLEVDNTNDVELYNMVLIDNLPERGDWHTFVKDSERLSAFNVSLADDPNFVVYFSDLSEPEQNVRVLDPADYVVEFLDANCTANDPTTPMATYTQEDWRGTSAWDDQAGPSTRSVRIRLADGVTVPPQTTLCVEFTCKINDPNVEPGTIAWNSFGYTYAVETAAGYSYLSATPLDVGIRVPGTPSIEKQLKNRSGASLAAERDETFSFLVFEGDITALNLQDGFDETDLQIALYDSNKKATLIQITVQAGKSVSDAVSLKGAQDLWGRGAFEFVHGEQYTVYELSYGMSNDWYYGYMSEGALPNRDRFYTFTYDRYGMQTITATNLFDDWDIEITKVGETPTGGAQTPLEGAVFALYGTGTAAAMDEAAYAELKTLYGLSQSFADISTIEAEPGDYTYYLQTIAVSDADGLVAFVGLGGSTYKVVELKAPNGYAPTSEVFKFRKPGTSDQLPATGDNTQDPTDPDLHVATATVVNYVAYELPETGGAGTALFTFAGLALMVGAGLLFLRRRTEG